MKNIRKIWVVAVLVLFPIVSWAENKPENEVETDNIQNTKASPKLCKVTTVCDDNETVVTGYGWGETQSQACQKALSNALAKCTHTA